MSRNGNAANGAFGKSTPRPSQDNLLIRVRDHDGRVLADKQVLIEHFKLRLSPRLVASGRDTQAGEFLLRLLAAADYAGKGNRPVMLHGLKLADGGFALTVSVPVDVAKKPGPPPDFRSDEDGVERTG